VADWRLAVTQQEARAKSLQEAVREADAKKRALEDMADTLRDECAKLKAANQVIIAAYHCEKNVFFNFIR
jgi:kinesin family member 5